jgi:hypothetical protein
MSVRDLLLYVLSNEAYGFLPVAHDRLPRLSNAGGATGGMAVATAVGSDWGISFSSPTNSVLKFILNFEFAEL